MSSFTETLTGDARLRYRWFHNALRVLKNIDAPDFPGPFGDWADFRDDPWRYFVRADDTTSARLYAIIEARFPFPIQARE